MTHRSAPTEAVAKVQEVLGCREIHAGSRPCAVHWAEWSGRGCSVAAAAADAAVATLAAERDAALAEASRLRGQIDTDGCAACGNGMGLCRDCETDAAPASVGRTEPRHDPHARLAPELAALLDDWDANAEDDNYSKGDAATDLRAALTKACGCERGNLPHDRRCPERLDRVGRTEPEGAGS